MSTATLTHTHTGAMEVLRVQAKGIRGSLLRNIEGLTHNDSLISPAPGGNCLNWVVGHLVSTNERLLEVLGQPPVLGKDSLRRYDRGSAELHDPAEALPLDTLLAAWDRQWAGIDAGLSAIAPEKLDAPAPFSPRNKVDETVLSLLTIVMFHQAYHAGQAGLLRRIAGREGAIR